MGALILLLLVTTRRMNQNQAAATAAAAAHTSTADATDPFLQQLSEDAFVVSLEETRRQSAIAADAPPKQALSIALLPPAPVSAEIQAKKGAKVQQLQEQLNNEQKRHAELLADIDAVKARLQDQTADSSDSALQMQELSQLKAQYAELDQQLQARRVELAELSEELDRDSESVEDAESLLKARESALLSLRKLVQEIPEEGVTGTDQTVVEFTNATGTHRSPILLDVAEAGFTFLPSQVRITEQDMEGFPGNDNPLLAGVLALHEHRHAQSATIKPYVLLLVRPDGSMPFYAAQRTLTDAGIHFGYELLEQDRKISAGSLQQSESAVLRQSILAALNRRETLYRGLIAEVDQLKETLAARKAAQVGERAIQMTPDGRLLMPDEQGSNSEALFAAQNEGQFYAGGQAPPPGSLTRRSLAPEPQLPETASPEAGSSVSAIQPKSIDDASPFESELSEADDSAAVIAEAFAKPSETGLPVPERNDFGNFNAMSDEPSATMHAESAATENPSGSTPFSIAQMPTDETSAADLNQLRNALRTSPDLYGNFGVPTQQSGSPVATAPPAMSVDGLPSQTNDSETEYPREPTGWSDSGTAPANLTTRTASPAQEFSAAQQPLSADVVLNPQSSGNPGGNGSGSSDGSGVSPSTDSESFLQKFMQRVEEVKGQRAPDPMLVQLLKRGWEQSSRDTDSSKAAASAGSRSPMEEATDRSAEPYPEATAAPAENAFDWAQLEDRLQARKLSSEQQPQQQQSLSPAWDTDPKTAEALPKSLSASEGHASGRPASSARFPDDTRFPSATDTQQPATATVSLSSQSQPAVAEPAGTQQVYYVIRVFVEPERLTIGDYEAVDTAGWDADQRLAMTLEVVSATMDEVWGSVRKDALPAVRFLVAPGAEAFQTALSQQLATVQIPTRGISKLSAEMTADRFFSDEPLPGQTSAPISQPTQTVQPSRSAATGSGQVSKGSL